MLMLLLFLLFQAVDVVSISLDAFFRDLFLSFRFFRKEELRGCGAPSFDR